MASMLRGSGWSESLEIMCDKNLIFGLQNSHLPGFKVKSEVLSFSTACKCSRCSSKVFKKQQAHQHNGACFLLYPPLELTEEPE
jgi:hypothetical protein